MKNKAPILITGCHRSGSTWIGNVLKATNQIIYVPEPLNFKIKQNLHHFSGRNEALWFPAIEFMDQSVYRSGFEKILSRKVLASDFDFTAFEDIKTWVSLRVRFFGNRRILLKDPIALFSSNWLYENYNTQNIILIRRPEAFISSIKKNKWEFDFNHLKCQEQFIDTYLKEYKKEIFKHAEKKYDIVDQGILLWNVFYSFVSQMKVKYKDWYFVSHEDISLNPIEEFEKIFLYLNIDFNSKAREYIRSTTNSKNTIEREDENVHVLNRNSKEVINTWRNRLYDSEIEKIQKETEDIRLRFYHN